MDKIFSKNYWVNGGLISTNSFTLKVNSNAFIDVFGDYLKLNKNFQFSFKFVLTYRGMETSVSLPVQFDRSQFNSSNVVVLGHLIGILPAGSPTAVDTNKFIRVIKDEAGTGGVFTFQFENLNGVTFNGCYITLKAVW